MKVARTKEEPGKGGFWTLDPRYAEEGEGGEEEPTALVEEEEFEERLMSLSPEQAAVEISELAGLPVAQGEEMSGSQDSS